MHIGVATVKQIPLTEDIKREKEFTDTAELFANLLNDSNSLNIPLVIHQGQRVKSKKEMREIEEPLKETRKRQRVSKRERPTRKERRKKDQVEEKIQNMMKITKEKKEEKEGRRRVKKQMRPGKSRRQNVSFNKKDGGRDNRRDNRR